MSHTTWLQTFIQSDSCYAIQLVILVSEDSPYFSYHPRQILGQEKFHLENISEKVMNYGENPPKHFCTTLLANCMRTLVLKIRTIEVILLKKVRN